MSVNVFRVAGAIQAGANLMSTRRFLRGGGMTSGERDGLISSSSDEELPSIFWGLVFSKCVITSGEDDEPISSSPGRRTIVNLLGSIVLKLLLFLLS